ncbi:J domain-containing protein [Desulfotalea psychrophila]|uniref:Related to heat shock protein DnaJ (Hsp40) n=1 Tax=Desulfotalea psychrophila (strain LSv54 / DSM 12343) TaxID=177439 RepID=Q6AMJ3_DESPS|nr:DnaJ domain-containing protein [Desulfotalea psychrophila]CAG36432.1 related to heat shock protein DnaJ (Hsp40) [Desulfotalea psychrophila LSv54]
MKNYYEILGLDKDCTSDELRRKYRKLAMKYHPDQNPDNPEFQEKFKEIAEAYGVLSDSKKRQEYDRFGAAGGGFGAGTTGFSYSQEEIFRDLFNDPQFQQMFSTILGEFQKSGLRSNPEFVQKSFFGKRGGMFLGGVMFLGSLAGQVAKAKIKEKLPNKETVMRSLGRRVGNFLGYGEEKKKVAEQLPLSGDIAYTLELSLEEMRVGKTVEISVPHSGGEEHFKVQVPAGSTVGQKLRLRGRGAESSQGRGDLYLELGLPG